MVDVLADVELLTEVLSETLPAALSDALVELRTETAVRIVSGYDPVPAPPVDPWNVVPLPSPDGADDDWTVGGVVDAVAGAGCVTVTVVTLVMVMEMGGGQRGGPRGGLDGVGEAVAPASRALRMEAGKAGGPPGGPWGGGPYGSSVFELDAVALDGVDEGKRLVVSRLAEEVQVDVMFG